MPTPSHPPSNIQSGARVAAKWMASTAVLLASLALWPVAAVWTLGARLNESPRPWHLKTPGLTVFLGLVFWLPILALVGHLWRPAFLLVAWCALIIVIITIIAYLMIPEGTRER